jgi:hypothetical protein
MLPCDQISEGQRGPAELLIKPNAEIMQCHLGHQTCLEPIQRMGAFAIKSKCMLQMGAHCQLFFNMDDNYFLTLSQATFFILITWYVSALL